MENQPHVDSPKKSISHGQSQNSPKSGKQDSSSSTKQEPVETDSLNSKVDSTDSSNANEAPNAARPIISVDVQKTMPYKNKQSVPEHAESDPQSNVDISPEVLASVVTTAVVNEAALTVETTEESSKGSKISRDSSKVDAAVEIALTKLSEDNHEAANLKNPDSEQQKPLPNGDIDHSPAPEAESRDISNDTASKEVVTSELEDGKYGEDDSPALNKDSSTCNGVPGIITVETISKSNSSSHSDDKPLVSDSLLTCGKIEEEIEPNSADSEAENVSDLSKLPLDQSPGYNHDESKKDSKEVDSLSGDVQSDDSKNLPIADTETVDIPGDACEDTETKESISGTGENKSAELQDIVADQKNDTKASLKEEMEEEEQKSHTLSDSASTSGPDGAIQDVDMSAMMTSQILTKEDLGESEGEKNANKSPEENGGSKCPETCEVGVGHDLTIVPRAATGDGGDEEMDGEPVSAGVDVTEESLKATETNSMPTGVESPTRSSPTLGTAATVDAPTEGEDSKDSNKEDAEADKASLGKESPVQEEKSDVTSTGDNKPSSAESRTSIPEAMVYQPPERKASASSTVSDVKINEKSQKDEPDGESSEVNKCTPTDVPGEDSNSQDEVGSTATVENIGGDESSEKAADVGEEGETNTTKGGEEESPKDADGNVLEASTDEVDTNKENNDDSNEQADENNKDTTSEAIVVEEDSKVTEEDSKATEEDLKVTEEDSKVTEEDSKVTEEDSKVAQEESETNVPIETESLTEEGKEDVKVDSEKEATVDDDSKKDDDVGEETAPTEQGEVEEVEKTEIQSESGEKDEAEVKEVAEKNDETENHIKDLEEPKTLVEESKEESEKEAAEAQEEKETDDMEREAEEQEGDDKAPDHAEIRAEEEPHLAAEEEGIVKNEAQDEEAPPTTDEAPQENQEAEVDNKVTDEGCVGEDIEEEKKDEEKQPGEEGEKRPSKSPGRRVKSPDKTNRRGVSPISSPPKPMKTPPSPQKPQKSSSPKKKNGTLSPIKTPKTPGSDVRKLPPIKAPVGLAPNPNLKNIRSKIGSFDNIRYKPGGGDKKVISKKLEWKATPKIGSLDHTLKGGEKKHGKGHAKSETKESKVIEEDQNELEAPKEIETTEADAVDEPEETAKDESTAAEIATES